MKKRNLRKGCAALVLLCLLLSLMPVSAGALETAGEALPPEGATGGSFGGSLSWTLDEEGTLSISGTGRMPDWKGGPYQEYYGYDPAPWSGQSGQVKRVVLEPGLTGVGANAFSGCVNLTQVSIPGSVTDLAYACFADCQSLESVTIPEGVTRLGGGAFMGCSNLRQVTLPSSITYVGWQAFLDCYGLQEVSYAAGPVSWGNIFIDMGNDNLLRAVLRYNAAGAAEEKALPLDLSVSSPAPAPQDGSYLRYTDGVYTIGSDVSQGVYVSAPDALPLDGAYLVTVDVALTEDVELTNYDAVLSWTNQFTLVNVENLQSRTLPIVSVNVGSGKIGVAGSQDVHLQQGSSLLRCTFLTYQRLAPGAYDFSLTVTNAAREDTTPLPWSGGRATGTLEIRGLSQELIHNYAPETAAVEIDAANWSFSVSSKIPCVVLYYDGSAYQYLRAQRVWWRSDTYSFTLPGDWDASREILVALRCDFTLDGAVNSTDASQVLRVSAGFSERSEAQLLVADVNGDGRLSSTDALQILRVAVELRTVSW